MNIYNLTKWQVIIMWIGAFLATAGAGDVEAYGALTLAIFIDTAIAIYTISWWKDRKK